MAAVEIAGIKRQKTLHMVNTSMEFKHPKYYAELRAIRRKQQAASIKQQAIEETVPHQEILEAQASSDKHQATSSKPQASSRKRQAS